MTNKEALSAAYKELEPFSDRQRWEFNSNLSHLNLIVENVTKDKKILDVGCGIGILALALKKLEFNVFGLEKHLFENDGDNFYYVSNLDALKSVWQKHELNVLESTQEKFDMVISVATLEHQPKPKAFFESLKESLKPGGLLYIATPNVANLQNRFRFFFGRSPISNIKEFFTDKNFYGHWREYTLDELKKMAEMSELEIRYALNPQTLKPKLKINFKNLFRFMAAFIPGAGDTNIVIAKKRLK